MIIMKTDTGEMISELIRPTYLYRRIVENHQFSRQGLEDLFARIQGSLNLLIETKLETGEVSSIVYDGNITRTDTGEVLGFVSGGADLTHGGKLNNFSINNMRRRYGQAFKSAIQKLGDNRYLLDIEINVYGSEDHISKKVDVRVTDTMA